MKANQIRIVLLVALALVFVMLYGKWNVMFHIPEPSTSVTQSQTVSKDSTSSSVPTINVDHIKAPNKVSQTQDIVPSKTESNPITVLTDVYKLKISPVNGTNHKC